MVDTPDLAANSNRKRSFFFRLRIVVALLLVLLVAGNPQPAQAACYDNFWTSAYICFDFMKMAKWLAQAAIWVANAAKDALAWLNEKFAMAMQVAGPIAAERLSNEIEGGLAQTKLAGKMQAARSGAVGDIVTKSVLPERTGTCATQHASQEAAVVSSTLRDAVSQIETLASSKGAGANADTGSPAYASVEVNDLCKLGFLDTSGNGRYGQLPAKMGCVQDNKYIDADMKLSSLIGRLQYPLPPTAHSKPTPDGHRSFIGATNTDPTGLGSEMDFVAAYKFCEHLLPDMPTPSHNSGTPGVADVVSIKVDRDEAALRTAAASECMRSLSYRTACPDTSKNALKNASGVSCYDAQQALCQRLRGTHADGGLNLTMKGDDPQYEAALTYCPTQGISQAMYDAIMARRCHDTGYVRDLSNRFGSNAAKAEHAVLFDCPAMEAAFEQSLNDEKERLNLVMQNLLLLRSVPVSSGSSAARIAK